MNEAQESFLQNTEVVSQDNNVASQAEVAVATQAPVAESQVSTEIVVDTPAENTNPETAVNPVVEEKPTVINEPINYWLELDQKSEGLVKDEDSFKGIIEKARIADVLATEKAELEKNQFKPANDYVKGLNEIILSGGTKDQVNAFVKLNGYGDLAELTPTEAKVAKMVLVDGFSEDVARKIVKSEFDISNLDPEDADDADKILITNERLRVSARSDVHALESYKKDLSVVNNPEKENAEKARLQEIAQISIYNKTVEQEASKIAKNFPDKLKFDFKVGEETIPFEDSVSQDFLTTHLPALVNDYFKDSLDPVNPETIGQAYNYAYGEYLKENIGNMLEKAYLKGNVEGVEKTVNRYENKSGLPRAEENTIMAVSEDVTQDFINKQMLGR